MAQVQRAVSSGGKQYLISEMLKNGDSYIDLGENCSIGNNLVIGNDCEIGNNLEIGTDCEIGNNLEIGNTFSMPLYEPQTLTEFANILAKGQKGIKLGKKADTDYTSSARNGYITSVDKQFLISGTSGVTANELITMVIKANSEVNISTSAFKVNGETGITTTQTFKDGSSATKTMTITNGIITDIS